jgi:hypothetical protein
MSLAIGYSDQYWDQKRHIIDGYGSDDRPYPAFWSMYEDENQAKYTAMAWLVAGFGSKVTDLNPGVMNDPYLRFRFHNLATVTAVVPGVVKFCEQLVPPEVPWPISEADFHIWLTAFSQGTPTWTGKTTPLPTETVPPEVPVPAAQSILLDTLSPEQRAFMNQPAERTPTVGT